MENEKEILYQDSTLVISYRKDNGIVYINGFAPEDATMEDVKSIMQTIVSVLKDLNPIKGVLNDTSKNKSIVDVELQQWIAEQYLNLLIPKNVKKYALKQTEELIPKLSYEQVIDEALVVTKQIAIRIFYDFKSAENWLMD